MSCSGRGSEATPSGFARSGSRLARSRSPWGSSSHTVGGSSAAEVAASRSLTAGARVSDASTVAGYIGLIAAAELCTAFVGSLSGAVVYAILLLVMLTHAVIRLAPTDDEVGATGLEVTHAILALSFLPLIRIVSLTAPVAGGSEAARYLIVGGLVLASIVWAAWGVGLPGIVLSPRAPMLQFAAVLAGVPLLVL